MIAKGIEYNIPVWIVSIDLKKVFDRINHEALFKALADQNLDDEHIALLQCLYKHQRGIVGEYDFPIIRGVRQGDVLSPLLFNAVLEHAIVKWKQQLSDEGFALIPNWTVSRLTNIRYADDLLLFGQSLDEAVSMLEKLASILQSYGLELNMKKTKIMSTSCPRETTTVCITEYGPVDILGSIDRHKYLGRCFCGDLKIRGKSVVDHRLSCACMKYKEFQHVFEDNQVSIKLGFKLFGSITSSTFVYVFFFGNQHWESLAESTIYHYQSPLKP